MSYLIGIDASRANSKQRTGVETYAYQVIQHLKQVLPQEIEVRLYSKEKLDYGLEKLPQNWQSCVLSWPPKRLWTQFRLSWEMYWNPPDVLFVPAHVFPAVHPTKTVMTVHDVATKEFPKSYNFWERFYSLKTAKYSAKHLYKVIVPSKFTKRELLDFSGTSKQKIKVIHHGFKPNFSKNNKNKEIEEVLSKYDIQQPYLFFVGRIEQKKNISRMIEVFEKLKQKGEFQGEFVLAGKAGHGYKKIKNKIKNSPFNSDIKMLGWVSEEEINYLLNQAELLFFTTLYEGFGFPVLEAFSQETPVATSKTTATKEIGGKFAEYSDPESVDSIYGSIKKILEKSEPEKQKTTKQAKQRVKNFSWKQAAKQTSQVLLN
jgi:glycosyltransferase involved in cell wall biosynthesis